MFNPENMGDITAYAMLGRKIKKVNTNNRSCY